MNKDQNGYFRIEDFIKVFLEAEDILRQKITNSIELLEDYQKQKAEALEKLSQLQKEEKVNAYGIMLGSMLTVQVLELQHLYPPTFRDLFVKVDVDSSSYQTDPTSYQGSAYWNTQFNL